MVGKGAETCVRLNDGDVWMCSQTFMDIGGCSGKINARGIYYDSTTAGDYLITAATDDFFGLEGVIGAGYDPDTGLSTRALMMS